MTNLDTDKVITVKREDLPALVAFDGCHKLYVLDTRTDVKEAGNSGYGIESTDDLPLLWKRSCFLRFVNSWGLDRDVIPQGRECETLTFVGFGANDCTLVGDEA